MLHHQAWDAAASLLDHLLPNLCAQRSVYARRGATGQTLREHEDVLDAMQERLDRAREMPRLRRQTVEHPFGTIKAWMGATHFLVLEPWSGCAPR